MRTGRNASGKPIGLYVREKNSEGIWRYRCVREGKGIKTGDLTPPFFARPFIGGKQTWKPLLAETFPEAKKELAALGLALDAQSKGLTVAEADALTNANRIPIRAAVDAYLEQKSGKAPSTVNAYTMILNEFVGALTGKVRFLDEITEDILRSYKKTLVDKGYAGKTIDTRINTVCFLLKKNRIAARIPRDEMPVVEHEVAVPYTDEELKRLFAAMDAEETVRYKFFLGTGCRDKEVTYAAWADIDFDRRTYHVRRKEDVGFAPKSHESRTIPLPDSLLGTLKERRKKAPNARWIFVNPEGQPDNHFLRKLKQIAKNAGLNCGQCKSTLTEYKHGKKRVVDVTCNERPICQHFYLHRFRKTCASRWERNGVPIRTVQSYLGHKNLETTMIYLGVTDIEKLRGNINAAFGD
jgi:integrase/recombinase XerD